MDMKLEVSIIPVSDVDRAKAFYTKLGWRLDIDYIADEHFRALQFTPPNSEASIIFGKGITSARPGSVDSLVLAVDDIEAAHADLVARGIEASQVFHYSAGPFNNSLTAVPGLFIRCDSGTANPGTHRISLPETTTGHVLRAVPVT